MQIKNKIWFKKNKRKLKHCLDGGAFLPFASIRLGLAFSFSAKTPKVINTKVSFGEVFTTCK